MRALIIIFLLVSPLYAEVIEVSIPANTSACNGEWTTKNIRVNHIRCLQKDKLVEVFENKFIVYGLDQNAIFGRLEFDVTTTSTSNELKITGLGSTPTATKSGDILWYRKQWQYRGIKKEERNWI